MFSYGGTAATNADGISIVTRLVRPLEGIPLRRSLSIFLVPYLTQQFQQHHISAQVCQPLKNGESVSEIIIIEMKVVRGNIFSSCD